MRRKVEYHLRCEMIHEFGGPSPVDMDLPLCSQCSKRIDDELDWTNGKNDARNILVALVDCVL